MSNSRNIPNRLAVSILLGIFMMLWGIIWLSIISYSLYTELARYNDYFETTNNPDYNLGIWNLIWSSHVVILAGILALIGGLGMLLRKKIGWIIIAAISVAETVHFAWLYYKSITAENTDNFIIYFTIGISLLFLISSVAIFLPQIRNRYSVKSKEVYFSIGLLVLLIIDFALL